MLVKSSTSGPTGSCGRDPDREIFHERSAYRDLAQVVIQDPDPEIIDLAQEIRRQRSCTSSPTEEIYRDLAQKILIHAQALLQDSAEDIFNTLCKRSSYRDLAQEVLQDPDADITTEILHKKSADRDLAQVLLQDPRTSASTGFC